MDSVMIGLAVVAVACAAVVIGDALLSSRKFRSEQFWTPEDRKARRARLDAKSKF